MNLSDKTAKVNMKGNRGIREVTIVTTRLTQEEARTMFPYRPVSKYAESRFGGNELFDDTAMLLNEHALRCGMCQAPTNKNYLNPHCPDCDGRSEYNGGDPRLPSLPRSFSHSRICEPAYDGEAD